MATDIQQPAPVPVVERPQASRNKSSWTNGNDKATRDVAWYQAELSRVPKIARQVFEEYLHLPEDKVLDHIYRVRDRAWDILPYPCIGLFRFLDFPACLSPVYNEVLTRVKTGETFLDLGCCFGQDIRKLVYDGASSENIIGVDTEPKFIDLGYELFGDRETLKARFFTADVFDDNFLSDLRGKVDIVFAGSFLHLFTFEQQTLILQQFVKLLRPVKGSMVFGRHMAMENGGTVTKNAAGWSLYHHSATTIRQLFDTTDDSEWDVTSQFAEYKSEGWDNGVKWQGSDEVKQQYFAAKRL